MSTSIGDGMATLAVAAVVISYLYLTHQSRQKRLEIIHQERLLAMEKGIPLLGVLHLLNGMRRHYRHSSRAKLSDEEIRAKKL